MTLVRQFLAIVGLVAWLLASASQGGEQEPAQHLHAHLRHPVAAARLADGKLVTANQRSGSVSLVDLKGGRVIAETPVGKSLSGLAVLTCGRQILVTDEQTNELVAMRYEGGQLSVMYRLKVTSHPAGVVLSPEGAQATVVGLWSRQLQLIDLGRLSDRYPPQIQFTVSLPLAPRLQLILPGTSRVLVADAFGGQLAVVDYASRQVLVVHEIEGHNLRGLTLSHDGKALLVAHQMLDSRRPLTEDAVSQGTFMRNVVRRISLERLLNAKPLLPDESVVVRLDDGWIHGAADPASLTTLAGNKLAVALAGNNMLALLDENAKVERRINVGARPLAVLRGTGDELLVVNSLSDSISLVDPTGQQIQRDIPLGPFPKLTSSDRGERLFYDGVQSVHGWFSCHSCHPDGHTNGLLADTSGDNSFGAPKRTLSLLGVAKTDSWAWNGETPDLATQVRKSLATTMHSGWHAPENVEELADYLRTLSPPPPLDPERTDTADKDQLTRGSKLFHKRGCVKCHAPSLGYTSPAAYNVGLADELGRKKFNPPSLRGVSQGRRYFHDNRASSLSAVFTEHGHGLESDLTLAELADLMRFLRSL